MRAFLAQLLLFILGLLLELGIPLFLTEERQKSIVKALGLLFICLAIIWFGVELSTRDSTDASTIAVNGPPTVPVPSPAVSRIITPDPHIDEPVQSTVSVQTTPVPATETVDSYSRIFESVLGLTFVSDADGAHDLFRIEQHDAPPIKLTALEYDVGWPAYSPDGREIALVIEENGSNRIALVDSHGMNFRLILNEIAGDDFLHPSWSPDGRSIAFSVRFPGRNTYDLYYFNLDNSRWIGVERPDPSKNMLSSTWSPDGRLIAFHSVDNAGTESDLYLYDFDSNSLRQLTNFPGLELEPAWSPDGEKVAFSRNQDIWIINKDGTQASPITNDQVSQMEPVWSPDGVLLAYQSGEYGNMDIFVVPSDGSQPPRQVTVGTASYMHPSWQP